MIGAEPGVDRRELAERPDHEAGARQQNQRQRDLDDQEAAPQTVRPRGRAGAARADQRLLAAGARGLRGRERAEEDPADGGGHDREQQRGWIETDFVEARGSLGGERDQHAQQGGGQQHAKRGSHGAQHRALDQELRRQTEPSAAKRRANRQLVLPRHAARDQQVRDVRAGDQKQHADRSEQHQERLSHVSDEPRRQRLQRDGDAAHHIGMRPRDVGLDPLQFPLGFVTRHAGLETPEREIARVVAALRQRPVRRKGPHRHEDVVIAHVPEAGGQHADDRKRSRVERQRAAERP